MTERRGPRRRTPAEPENPFAVLGLPALRDLSDEDVRAAWRRIAAVTHPDLEDGGDPARFSAAAAAYVTLKTSFGRGEALADLGSATYPGASRRLHRPGAHRAAVPRAVFSLPAGWPWLRAAVVAAAVAGVAAVGWTPATIALVVGAVTWALAPVTVWGPWRRDGRDR